MDRGRGLSLVTRRADRDPALAGRLRALHAPLTRYFLRAIGDRIEVEDLVQDVFVRILRRGSLDSDDNFTGYVFQTANSVLQDRHRRRAVRHSDRHVSLTPEVILDAEPSAERHLIGRDTLRETSMVLAQLPERTRFVFVLRRMDGLGFAEIARRLGISVSAAEKHMLRATRHLLASTQETE